MKTALILTCFNRPNYLADCLDSLKAVKYPKGTVIIMVDDCSTDKEAIKLFNEFTKPGVTIKKFAHSANAGIKAALKLGYTQAWEAGVDIAINLDSDTIVKPDFMDVLLRLKNDAECIVSGFNSQNTNSDGTKRNPNIAMGTTTRGQKYLRKRFGNGVNLVVNRDEYFKYILPGLESKGNWDNQATANADGVIVSVPSVVQHIGYVSSMGHNDMPDYSTDFKQFHLPDVTLFGIDAHDPAGIKRAAEICEMNTSFGDLQIITERLFYGREGYSEFCIKQMTEYVKTSHVLIIHPDGYILNPKAWDNDWLQYDYAGASWGYKDNMNVGNGGFSLRSKKLLDIIAGMDIKNTHPEDDVICRQLRPLLETNYGIKFAPEEVANRFSIEAYGTQAWKGANKYDGQFGFHGYHVDMNHLPQWMKPARPVQTNKQKITTWR